MLQRQNGFTLVELLISIAIFGLVVSMVINSKVSQTDQNITSQQAEEMQQCVRCLVFLMAYELRTAGYNPEIASHDTGITNAGANTISFNRVASDDGDDNDNDSTTDESGELETVVYALQDSDGDGDLDVTVSFNGAGAQIIAENIPNLTFTYFDEDGADTADLDEIRSVLVTVQSTVDVNELDRYTRNNTRTLSSMVYLRNLGF